MQNRMSLTATRRIFIHRHPCFYTGTRTIRPNAHIDVYMESEEEFSKVEFEIIGTSLIEAYGGILEEAGYSQVIYKTMYLNFGHWIPAKQKFLLTKLKIENTKRENPICLKSIKVSDNRSHFIQVNGQSCLMYNE